MLSIQKVILSGNQIHITNPLNLMILSIWNIVYIWQNMIIGGFLSVDPQVNEQTFISTNGIQYPDLLLYWKIFWYFIQK